MGLKNLSWKHSKGHTWGTMASMIQGGVSDLRLQDEQVQAGGGGKGHSQQKNSLYKGTGRGDGP